MVLRINVFIHVLFIAGKVTSKKGKTASYHMGESAHRMNVVPL